MIARVTLSAFLFLIQDFSQQIFVECVTCAMHSFSVLEIQQWTEEANPYIHGAYVPLDLSYFGSVLFKAENV